MKFTMDYYANLESKIPTGKLRTRFAPSPTGYMHIGNLRTALYAYLLAKKENGTFILRIEDTDQAGLPSKYVQSERKEIYTAYAELLINRGHAYRCFCDKEVLDEQRSIHRANRVPHKYDGRCALLSDEKIAARLAEGLPYVIRQKMPAEGVVSFDDLVYGRVDVKSSNLDDQVLIKRDGMPTYNFANVVDDHLMGITHIIRGSEFLPSTPKYNLLYEGFGWKAPEFIHCAPIMKDATRKLSKRDGDAYFSDFVEKGYLVEAIINYIALLGWSPGNEEEKFTLSELESVFDIKGISKDPAIFDYKNLNSLNGAYIRAMSDEDFYTAALPYIKTGVKRKIDAIYVASILKERCELLSEIPEQLNFVDELHDYSPELYINKKMNTNLENSKDALAKALPVLENINNWSPNTVREELLKLVQQLGLKNGRILWPLRIALTGKTFTPGSGIEISVILGKDETIKRINKAILLLNEFISHKPYSEALTDDPEPLTSQTIAPESNDEDVITVSEDEPSGGTPLSVESKTINNKEDNKKEINMKELKITDPEGIEFFASLAKLDVKRDTEKFAFMDTILWSNRYIKYINQEAVEKRAAELDKKPVTPETSAVFGLPVAIDDNICTVDLPTTCASKMLTGFRPPYDATVVSRLREQGSIILCKTNMDEFGIGSYSGAAETVAEGYIPFGIGSDSSGSVRLSAAFHGLIGYKPTYGAVSRHGLISCSGSLEQIGIITRTVYDAAILASVIAGYDAKDATSNPEFIPDFSGIENFDVKGKKIGIPKEYFTDDMSKDIYDAFNRCTEVYKSLGAELVDISLPNTKHCLPVSKIITAAEASSNLAKFDGVRFGYRTGNYDDIDSLYINSRSEGFGEEIKLLIILGTYLLSSGNYDKYYKKAKIARTMICEDFKEAAKKCDVILTPVSHQNVVKTGNASITANTVSANIAGLPAISMFCENDKDGSPINMQLIGSKFDDANLLGFANAYEREANITKIMPEVRK
ncbi:glutamate--trna ligase [Holotrichia oblita]|nr:glutamate--trna ligase [Holotrichia oblita]